MMKAVAIYSRVSTDSQTTENQERELRAIAERMGWMVKKWRFSHADQGLSERRSEASKCRGMH
jgi:DNA invertase Pin-like site-specific DNA recombinase